MRAQFPEQEPSETVFQLHRPREPVLRAVDAGVAGAWGLCLPPQSEAAPTQAPGQPGPQSGVPSLCLGRPWISWEGNWRCSEGAVRFLFLVKFLSVAVAFPRCSVARWAKCRSRHLLSLIVSSYPGRMCHCPRRKYRGCLWVQIREGSEPGINGGLGSPVLDTAERFLQVPSPGPLVPGDLRAATEAFGQPWVIILSWYPKFKLACTYRLLVESLNYTFMCG